MISTVIDIGPNITEVVGPVALAVAGWIGLRKLRREFEPNSGSSMRDAIDRIETRQIEMEQRLQRLEDT